MSIKTPNPRDLKHWEQNMEEQKYSTNRKKIRHSKNASQINGNTPYSIFLNVQPNISIIRSNPN